MSTAAMANPLHYEATDPAVLWSPGNVSEAIPGVSTALNWSFIDDAIETAARRAFYDMGSLHRHELALGQRTEERFMVCFYGRTVANIDAMRVIGDRTPGTSANAIEEQLFGVVRPDAVNHPTNAYVATVATRAPRTAVSVRAKQLRLRAEVVSWWRDAVLFPPADLDSARALLKQARERYTHAFELATLASMLGQALYDQIVLLAENASLPGLQHRLVTGYDDMIETGLATDLWTLSAGRIDLPSFLLRQGFHGPDEGQMASRVWREDAAPLLSLAARYARLDPDNHPAKAVTRQRIIRRDAEAELFAKLGRLRAPGAKLLLGAARALIPQRELGKATYTQCLDAARIAARVIGRALADQGRLDDPDDVFGLTYEELTAATLPRDCKQLAAERQAIRADYLTTDLPEKWTGTPPRVPIGGNGNGARTNGSTTVGATTDGSVISGEAVGGGAVTGRVRIVVDPATEELEPGEILVCRATDPGWTSLFQLAAGVAVDYGGTMSHAAIVARELGIPCVTCTVNATQRLHNGDLVRLDGDTGEIAILEEASA